MSNEKECAVEVCERSAMKGRTLCSPHYQRKQRLGDVQAHIPIRSRQKIEGATCTVDGCQKPRAKGRDLCHGHRERVRRTGDVRANVPLVRLPRKIESDICSVDGCFELRAKQPTGRYAVCAGHRARLNKTGRLDAHIPLRHLHSGRVDEWCSYKTAHRRITNKRGRAADQPCVTCGKPAIDWSYRGGAKHEFSGQFEGSGSIRRWSGDPDDYDAMCRSCHIASDRTLEARDRRAADTEQGKELLDKDARIAQLEVEIERLKVTIKAMESRDET